MPRDTAWVEEMVAAAPPADTRLMRQTDFSAAGLDLPLVVNPNIRFQDAQRLSTLLHMACDDFRKVLLDPRYRISVRDDWHTQGMRCAVCVAGAVIAKTYKADRRSSVDPEDFGEDAERRLETIDWLRHGSVPEALEALGRTEDAKSEAAIALGERWVALLGPVRNASNRIDGFVLLSRLRGLESELREAGF